MRLAYCDYMAHLIADHLRLIDRDGFDYLASVGRPEYDLDAQGILQSTTKTLDVTDRHGTTYQIIIKEKN